jgi:hypothetical protein
MRLNIIKNNLAGLPSRIKGQNLANRKKITGDDRDPFPSLRKIRFDASVPSSQGLALKVNAEQT